MKRRPNFLLIVTDQQRADHLGCYGNAVVRTPNIDAIAARGRKFERFYVASPVCMANRASLMTGRLPSLHGVRHNGIPLSRDATTFVDLLQESGYKTALIGKSHLQNMGYDAPIRRRWSHREGEHVPPESLQDADKRTRSGRSYDNEWTPYWDADESYHVETPFYGFDHVRLCTFHGDEVRGDYARWLAAKVPNAEQLRGRDNAIPDDRYSAPQSWRTRVPEHLYPSTYVADETCAWLEQIGNSDGDEPFFMTCSFPDPHHPYTPPGRYWDMYDPDSITLPESFHARASTALVRAVENDTRRGATNREGYTPFTVSKREAQEIIALTYGMITMIDDCVGRIMNCLSRLGLGDDTVVLFTSDHGDWMGDHGMMLKGPLHYQGLIRVPFIWSDTADRRSTGSESALAGTIDIARTVLERAGVAPNNGNQGQSLLADIRPGQDQRAMVIESEQTIYKFGKGDRFRVRSLVESRYRISISDEDDIGELYDLECDPNECINLWDSAEHGALKMRLLERLGREMIRMSDDAPMPTALA